MLITNAGASDAIFTSHAIFILTILLVAARAFKSPKPNNVVPMNRMKNVPLVVSGVFKNNVTISVG